MDSRKYTATPLVAFVTRVAKSFFGIHKDDTSSGVQKKVAETIFHRVIYSLADYWLMFVSGLFIIMMDRQLGMDRSHSSFSCGHLI